MEPKTKTRPAYTPEQEQDIREQIAAAQEDRDYVNACDRLFRRMTIIINSEMLQNIDGISVVDKFEGEAWGREWNAFRARHNMPTLDFELLKERAKRAAGQR